MATISLRTNKGDGTPGPSSLGVTFANPGTAAPTADIELNINVGLSRPWEPQELDAALNRFREWLISNQPRFRGL